ncbi:MAG: hypothetical protein E3J26_03220, partial [Candidatus Zixiibacteriota bacterium]
NPMMLYPDRQFVREGLEKLDFLVVCDLFETETTALADVVLPLSSWAEYAGEYVNLEGKVQRTERAIKPIGQSRPGFEIMNILAEKFGEKLFSTPNEMASEIDSLLHLESTIEMPGEFLEVKTSGDKDDESFPIPLFIVDDPHHSGHLTEKCASLVIFAGEAYIEMSADLAARYGLKEGAPVRVESEVGKVIAPVKISEYLDTDMVLVPRNFSATAVTSLLMRKRRFDRVKISKVAE